MKSSLPAARQAETVNAVVATLSQCLDLDAGMLIPELRQAEELRHRNAPVVSDIEGQAPEELAEEEMIEEEEAPKQKRNGKAAKVDNDVSDLLPVRINSCNLLGPFRVKKTKARTVTVEELAVSYL